MPKKSEIAKDWTPKSAVIGAIPLADISFVDTQGANKGQQHKYRGLFLLILESMFLAKGFVGNMSELNTDSIPLDSLPSTDRTDDQNSDQEDAASAAQREDGFIDSDYWFGSIYFRCVLAQEIFERVTPGCSVVTIDVGQSFHYMRPY